MMDGCTSSWWDFCKADALIMTGYNICVCAIMASAVAWFGRAEHCSVTRCRSDDWVVTILCHCRPSSGSDDHIITVKTESLWDMPAAWRTRCRRRRWRWFVMLSCIHAIANVSLNIKDALLDRPVIGQNWRLCIVTGCVCVGGGYSTYSVHTKDCSLISKANYS